MSENTNHQQSCCSICGDALTLFEIQENSKMFEKRHIKENDGFVCEGCFNCIEFQCHPALIYGNDLQTLYRQELGIPI